MEREALAYGLNPKRYNKSTFLVGDEKKEPDVSNREVAAVECGGYLHRPAGEESTRLLFRAPWCSSCPMGRTFAEGDNDGALEKYAERIEYPVVLKPAEGSMGVGVTANIADASELRSALGRLQESVMGTGEFIVESISLEMITESWFFRGESSRGQWSDPRISPGRRQINCCRADPREERSEKTELTFGSLGVEVELGNRSMNWASRGLRRIRFCQSTIVYISTVSIISLRAAIPWKCWMSFIRASSRHQLKL